MASSENFLYFDLLLVRGDSVSFAKYLGKCNLIHTRTYLFWLIEFDSSNKKDRSALKQRLTDEHS